MDFLRNFFKKFIDHFIPSERNVYRPHILRKPWLIFFVALVLTTEGVFLTDLITRQSAFDFVAAVLPGEIIAFTNEERAVNNIGAVTENTLLDSAAQAKAEDMAAKGYFSHVSPDGTEPWAWVKASGYNYQYAGENLAVRFVGSSDVVNAWMASPTHRANIVKPAYTEIGVGVAQGEFQGEPATYVVQYFGTPRTTAEVVSTPQPPAISQAPATSAPLAAQVQGAETEGDEAGVPVPAATYTEPTQASLVQHQDSAWGSIAKGLLRTESGPSIPILWILGAVAAIMVIGLALTFFIHIQIQPAELLIGGAVVGVMALAFIALNLQSTFIPRGTQSAAVFGAVPSEGGFIDSVAAQRGE